ncbi:MAG: DUF5069 domain-containing protein [Candidatus Methylacidiphilales bacterium]|nr:DUF5069 domain-containing protein [Candidatus Methylacidiphilales bacterium]
MNIPGLRSPYDRVNGLVYFGRMLDKIRLHQQGRLTADYIENLGQGFDLRCCRLLRVGYDEITSRTLQGGTDEEILSWAQQKGRVLEDDDIEVWNDFMRKRGWKDEAHERLLFRLKEANAAHRTDIETMFDYIDFDEGRKA